MKGHSSARRHPNAALLSVSQAAGFDDGDPGFADAFERDELDEDTLSTWSSHDAHDLPKDMGGDVSHAKQRHLPDGLESGLPGAWLCVFPLRHQCQHRCA